jgi:hypothetical protein
MDVMGVVCRHEMNGRVTPEGPHVNSVLPTTPRTLARTCDGTRPLYKGRMLLGAGVPH